MCESARKKSQFHSSQPLNLLTIKMPHYIVRKNATYKRVSQSSSETQTDIKKNSKEGVIQSFG